MADRFPPPEGHAQVPPGLFGMLTVLMSGLVIALLYFARDIFIPITLAVLLSFLLAPAVRWLRRLRVARVVAVAVTVLVAFVAVSSFAAIVTREVSSLAQQLPGYRHNIEAKIHSLPGAIPGGGLINRAAGIVRDLRDERTTSEAQSSPQTGSRSPVDTSTIEPAKPLPVEIRQPDPEPLQIVQSIVGPLLQPLATGGLVIVFVIMILLEREDLRDRLLRLAGRRDLQRTTAAMDDAAQRISRYLLSQLVVNAIYGLPIGVGLTVIGIPNAALWGIVAALLRFIPYLGIVIAACFPLALAIAVDPGWILLVWTILLFVAMELVVGNIVEPWLFGARTGLSSIALIAAATFWTWLWGPIGLLLSTPLTVCLGVLGRHVPQLQFLDVILGNEPVLTPEETFYQRLLANDPEEASEQAEEFAKERSLAEFFDKVAIPALARAQTDSDRDALAPGSRTTVREGVRAMLENLSDDDVLGNATLTAERTAPSEGGVPPVIFCVAGRNELDEAAASLLVHLLRSESHFRIEEALPADALASDNSYLTLLDGATLVCLSLISTGSPARARYLVRRVRRRAPRARVLVGFWGTSAGGLPGGEARIVPSDHLVATSLRDAIANIAAILTGERVLASVSSPPNPDVTSAVRVGQSAAGAAPG
jgi:predicted PurR-regulated permease PerM